MNRSILFVFVIFFACVEPLKVDFVEHSPIMVVDGLITDTPGPYEVKLFYTTSLDSTVRKSRTERGASVWIQSDANEIEKLNEMSPGVYRTAAAGIRGTIGRSYKLKIVTSDNKSYETNYEMLSAPGYIDSVYVKFEPESVGNNRDSQLKDALKLLVNARGLEGAKNFYRWRWKSIYKAESFPELRKEFEGIVLVPAPEPCSGYVRNGNGIRKIGECTCCFCWSTQYSQVATTSPSAYVANAAYNNANIGEIVINSMLFLDKLYVEVEQLSMTEDAYEFWTLVEAQQKAAGNIFQPNATQVRGNVRSTSNADEQVFGIFSASAVTKKGVFINPVIIPYALGSIDTVEYDCRNIFVNATTEKPSFW